MSTKTPVTHRFPLTQGLTLGHLSNLVNEIRAKSGEHARIGVEVDKEQGAVTLVTSTPPDYLVLERGRDSDRLVYSVLIASDMRFDMKTVPLGNSAAMSFRKEEDAQRIVDTIKLWRSGANVVVIDSHELRGLVAAKAVSK